MAMQELNKQEMNEVSGGLGIIIDRNPVINADIDITPFGVFSLLSGLLAGLTGFLSNLRLF
ncbi:hypothetical protein JX580_11330 [Thiomicrospira microaerophila]|uniref:hypothetical protein n=1 Tax=Thiomicrospira microaerophila TaxID=406020 RepID=UPI00200F05A7|nr:hypothetical protein [Thiomicrospira microaerophila]UQB42229.1 hypothetical protein JX580_11330 [Thiomicrospira microaerophila]